MDLTNAAAIVTGGTGGVGSATVRKLAQMGATVVIAAVSRAGTGRSLEEVVLSRERNGLGPVAGAQLGEDRRHVELDGPLGDVQGPRDLLGGQALGKQL